MGRKIRVWLDRLREGDQSAFLPLYEKTAPGLMRFLLWRTQGDRPLAEDILQETFVRFLLHLDNIEAGEDIALQTYLLRIAKNCLIDKVARTPQATNPHVPVEELHALPDTKVLGQERAVELRELAVAMDSLDKRESDILWLRDGLGMSHREVAETVGITEQACRQAYVRAKRHLTEGMAERLLPQGVAKGVSYVPT